MSVWTALHGWIGALSKGAGPVAVDVETFDAAMAAVTQCAKDAKAGTLTPIEALQTIDATLKAVAIVAPVAAQFESYVEAAEVVAEVATDLGILRTDPGAPLGSDGVNPNSGAPLGI